MAIRHGLDESELIFKHYIQLFIILYHFLSPWLYSLVRVLAYQHIAGLSSMTYSIFFGVEHGQRSDSPTAVTPVFMNMSSTNIQTHFGIRNWDLSDADVIIYAFLLIAAHSDVEIFVPYCPSRPKSRNCAAGTRVRPKEKQADKCSLSPPMNAKQIL